MNEQATSDVDYSISGRCHHLAIKHACISSIVQAMHRCAAFCELLFNDCNIR